MTKGIIFIWLILIMVEGKCQNTPKNSVFFEIFGNGGPYSINYERAITPNFYGRIGACRYTGGGSFATGIERRISTFPILVTYITGHKKSHFEAGGGVLIGKYKFINRTESDLIFDLTSFIGYRYQSSSKGVLYRIGLTPFLSLDNEANFPGKTFISAGFSIGYHF